MQPSPNNGAKPEPNDIKGSSSPHTKYAGNAYKRSRSEILPNLLSCILLQERIFLSGSDYVQPGSKPVT